MNEEIVVVLDANPSMGEEIGRPLEDIDDAMENDDFLGTTKFDVARYMVQELLLRATAKSSDGLKLHRVLALVTLGEEKKQNGLEYVTGHVRSSGNCSCYTFDDHIASTEWYQDIVESIRVCRELQHDGDFVTGLVLAANAMLQQTTVGAGRRRLVLLTDARHKVLVPTPNHDPMEALVQAMNRLGKIGCTLDVIGMGFRGINPIERDEEESDGEESSQSDFSDIQEENELFLMDLVQKLGGRVHAIGISQDDSDVYGIQKVLRQLSSDNFRCVKTNQTLELPNEIDVKKEVKIQK